MKTPLCLAVLNRDVDSVCHILFEGCDVEDRGMFSKSPLHLAVEYEQSEIFQMLLSAGADPRTVDLEDGTTPLHTCFSDSVVLYPELFDGSNGEVRFHRDIMFNMLLTCDVDVNAQTNEGETVLHEAVLFNVSYVDKLLARGANCSIANNDGYTPMYSAVKCELSSTISSLLSAGSDIDVILPSDETMLHEFIRRDRVQIVLLLIKHGANPLVVNSDNISAYDVALSLPSHWLYRVMKKRRDERMLIQERKLAVMMCTHERLGQHSMLRCLDPNLFKLSILED